MTEPPDGYRDSGETVLSNFDYSIDRGLEARLRGEKVTMQYAAWGFSGEVWWADGYYHCLVSVHGRARETLAAAILDDLMDAVRSTDGTE